MSRRPAVAPARPRQLLLRKTALALLIGATASSFGATDERVSRYYEDALVRFEKKDHAGAIIQLKNAIQIDRSQLAVQVLMGRVLLADAQVAAAEVALLEALRLGVNRAEIAVPLAQAYIAQGKQATVFEQAALKPDGLSTAVRLPLLLLRAGASGDLGDTRSALASIAEARALDPSSAESWLAEVPIRVRMRELGPASAAADKALALAPKSADAWYQKGTIAHLKGELAEAVSLYDRAIAAQADHIEARVARAGLLIDLQRHADAAKELTEAKRLSPREPRVAYLRALLAEREGRVADAKAGLNEVTALLDPVPVDYIRFRPQLLMLNGLAHFSLDEREKAKPYLELLQRSQGQGPASKLLAQIYLGEKNPVRAGEVLDTYLRGRPNDAQAIALLATALMAQGQTAKASSLMQDALRQNDAPQFRSILGLSLLGGGHVANAKPELEAAFKRDPSQIQAGVALVSLYQQARDHTQALAVAGTLAKQRPNDPAILTILGNARQRAGDAAGARAAFEQALKASPDSVAARLHLARIDLQARAYDAAEARLAEVLKMQERNLDAMIEMATLGQLRGQPDEALRWLQRASELAGPRDTRPGLAMVAFQLQRGQAQPALEAAKRLTSKAPEDPTVLLALAQAQLAAGDNAGARSTLTATARLAGFDAPMQVQIALLQMRADNLAGASYSLEKALSEQPAYLPALALMAEVEIKQSAWAKAEQRARAIVQAQPKQAVGHSLLGDLAAAQGQRPAAVEAYRRAHQIEPTSLNLQRLFLAMLAQGADKQAIQLAEGWIRAHPTDRPIRRSLANAHARAGNLAAARTSYEELLKGTPGDADALNNLANVLLRQKDAGALAVAERALVIAPGSAAVLDTVGWAAFQARQIDRALQLLRDARLRDPENPDIRYHLAAVLAQTGRAAEARQELSVALQPGRSFESIAEAEALSRSLR